MIEGEQYEVDPSGDPTSDAARHAKADDEATPHPLADPAKDPTPGVPGHAKPDDAEA
jgi:hypothetical protein